MSTTVKDLIEKLQKFPEDFLVVIATDEEGNDFHAVQDFGIGIYDEESHEFSSWLEYEPDDEGDLVPVTPRRLALEESNALVIWP